MSGRFWDGDEDYEDRWRSRLRQIDTERALRTKPALRALNELREALLALPERRLLLGQACAVPFGADDEYDYKRPQFCAMGAWLYRKKVARGDDPEVVAEELAEDRYSNEDYGYEVVMAIADEAKRLGMSRRLAEHIQWINDDNGWETETEEHRFERVLAWTNGAINRNPHSTVKYAETF